MVRISVLNDALKKMFNVEKRGKRQILVKPSSRVIIKFLSVIQKHGYIGEFEYVDDHRAGKIVVELNGRLNKCGVISPWYNVGVSELEVCTARLLPDSSDAMLGEPYCLPASLLQIGEEGEECLSFLPNSVNSLSYMVRKTIFCRLTHAV